MMKTIPRHQYEAPSWVPNLLQVKDSQQEINDEEREEFARDGLLYEVEGTQGEMRYRIGLLGDVGRLFFGLRTVGAGKSTLLSVFLKKAEPTNIHATNG